MPPHRRLGRRTLPVPLEVIDLILYQLNDGASLMRLRRVCKALLASVDPFARRRFDPNKLLAHFVVDFLRFRQLQAQYGAVISGSRVILFFQDCFSASDSDLDVYLFPGTARVFGDHLIVHEHYVYTGDSWEDDVASEPAGPVLSLYNTSYLRRVYKFAKGSRKIDLVVALDCPIRSILHFHSTPVMNGITWNKAFSLFPRATFERHDGMVLADIYTPALQKYRDRNFTLYDVRVAMTHRFKDYLRTGIRWIGDDDTWIVSLDVAGITPPTSADDLDRNAFVVVGEPVIADRHCLWTTAYRIEDAYFQHALLARPCVTPWLFTRFANTVLNCVARRWSQSGTHFAARVRIGRKEGWEHVISWDRLFVIASTAWRIGQSLSVEMNGETARFYALGGTVLTRLFVRWT